MIFFIWRGKGYLVLLAIIGTVFITAIIGMLLGFRDASWQIGVLEFIVSLVLFIPIWIYGKRHNVPLELINKNSGEEITIKNPHSFIFIPIQYWAIIWPAFIFLVFTLSPFIN